VSKQTGSLRDEYRLTGLLRGLRLRRCGVGHTQLSLQMVNIRHLATKKYPEHTISGTVDMLTHGLVRAFRIMLFQRNQNVTVGDPLFVPPSRKRIQTLYILQRKD
jgi:hypothetical protein